MGFQTACAHRVFSCISEKELGLTRQDGITEHQDTFPELDSRRQEMERPRI